MEENKEKELVIGQFKTKRKFISFMSAVSGARVRLIREVAYLDGSKLSGMLEGVKFKITICDENTINFEEVDSNKTDNDMIKRLINDLETRDVTGYAQKFVISDLEFKDEDDSRCYLEVEHKKPVDRFRSLLDDFQEEEEKSKSLTQSISKKGLSVLDSLFSDDEEYDEDHVNDLLMNELISEFNDNDFDEMISESKEENSESFIEEQFHKMNEVKINELKSRIEDTNKDIFKYQNEFKVADKKVTELKDNLQVLNSRLEQMYSGDEPNGYVFFVSEEQKNDIDLKEDDKELVSKISKLMGLKEEALFEHLKQGFYNIKIAKSDGITNQDFELEKEILEKVNSIDINGKILIKEGQFEYKGDLTWHQLVQRMQRAGFIQDPEFDKLCNSNSYDSKWDPKVKVETIEVGSHNTNLRSF